MACGATARRLFRRSWRVSPTFTLDTSALIHPISSGLWGDTDSDSDEGLEYSQEGYEESFIDDDEGVHDGPGSDIDPIPLPIFHGDDEEVTEVDLLAVPRQRGRQGPIVISSDEEDDGNYTDANTHGDYIRSWNEEEDEDVDYHDARSDSVGHGYHDYGSDGELDDDGSDNDFYGYL